MTNKQRNKLKMYKVVISVCGEASAVTSQMPSFTQAIQDLKLITEEIDRMFVSQMERRKGVTKTLNRLKVQLNGQFAMVCSTIFVHASNTNNLQLREKTNYTLSELVKMSHYTRITTCSQLISDVRMIENIFTDAHLNEEEFNHLEAMLNEYKILYLRPRELRVDNSMNTVELKLAFKKADTILREQADRLAVYFKERHPGFFNKYRNARKIEDIGIRHTGKTENGQDNGEIGDLSLPAPEEQ